MQTIARTGIRWLLCWTARSTWGRLAGAALGLFLSLLPQAWALPTSLGQNDWFSYSAISSSFASAPLVDMTSGSSSSQGRTSSSVSRLGGTDPFAPPGAPLGIDAHQLLDVAPRISGTTYFSAAGAATLGQGAARGFARMGWGDGHNTVHVTSAFGDIITVAPGGILGVDMAFSGRTVRTLERVTPHGGFAPETVGDPIFRAIEELIRLGSDCQAQFIAVICTGPDFAFGVAAKITLSLGVWDYSTQTTSPFSSFGDSPAINCAGSVICVTSTANQGVATPVLDGEELDEFRDSHWESGGFLRTGATHSLSKGSGGTFYVGVQLDIELDPEISQWGSLDACLAGPWGRAINGETLCRPTLTEPGLAVDMMHSLDVRFSGDAAFSSRSGIFLSGRDLPEPAPLLLVLAAFAGAVAAARRRIPATA